MASWFSESECFNCGRETHRDDRSGYSPFELLRRSETVIAWCSEECLRVSIPAWGGPRCSACGIDLTPTPEQLRALERFGNPLRRPPCLETEDGFHVYPDITQATATAGATKKDRSAGESG